MFFKITEINKKLKLNDIIVTCSDQKNFLIKEKCFYLDQLDINSKILLKKNLIYLKHYLLVLVADGSLIMMI